MVGNSEKRTGSRLPIGSLLGDLKEEFAHLVRSTTMLLRVELEENVETAAKGLQAALLGYMIIGMAGIFLLLGIDLLAISLLAPEILDFETAAWLCTLSLATILGVAGLIIVKRNKAKIQPGQLVPKKTLATIEEHADWLADRAEDIVK